MHRTSCPPFAAVVAAVAILCICDDPGSAQTTGKPYGDAAARYAGQLLREGKQAFRFDTFGSEDFWGGQLKLHQAIQGQKFGGVGPGISPKKALELGLKVDMEAVPANIAAAIKAGKVDLSDAANTLLLLKANAVVGVTGLFEPDDLKLTDREKKELIEYLRSI